MTKQIADLKILCVDDNGTVRRVIQNFFKELGVSNFAMAENGVEAMMLLQDKSQGDYDLVLSDLNMDGMDGFELLKTIRSSTDSKIRKMRFIMITGRPENVKTAVNLGANQVLEKPFSAADMKLRIEWVFGELIS